MQSFQDPFKSELWDQYVKSSTVCESAEESSDPMVSLQTPSRLLSSSGQPSSSPITSPVLAEIVTRTKTVALDKLTNLEFWMDHLESIMSEECVLEAAADGWTHLSRSFIQQLLQIINAHLSQTYPNISDQATVKNFFPKLEDFLTKRLASLMGEQDSMEVQKDDESVIEERSEEYHREDSFVNRISDQNHGRHKVEVSRDKKGCHVIICDGFHFRSRSNLMWRNNFFKCPFRACKAFIKIKDGNISKYPSRGSHLNHPIPKTLRLLKES